MGINAVMISLMWQNQL